MKKILSLIIIQCPLMHAMEQNPFTDKLVQNTIKTIGFLSKIDAQPLGTLAAFDFAQRLRDRQHKICDASRNLLQNYCLIDQEGEIPNSLCDVMSNHISRLNPSDNQKDVAEILTPKFPALDDDVQNTPLTQLRLVEG